MKLQHHRSSSTAPRPNEAGATLVEWFLLAGLICVVIAVVVVAAIKGTSEPTASSRPAAVREVTDVTTYKMLYQGKKWLYCVTGYEGQIEVIKSCDYGRFYREHPELSSEPG